MEIFTVEGLALLARWVHFMAGIVWIGLLYYFNFVQTPFMAQAEPDVRTAVIRLLVPRALNWFRYTSMVTVAAGITIILIRFEQFGSGLFGLSYGVSILTGMSLGFIIFINAQAIIWPQQQIVVASAERVAGGGEPDPRAASALRRTLLASRTNLILSIPMLFFMATASHLPLFGDSAGGGELWTYWIVATAIMLAVEANAVWGTTGATTKPLEKIGPSILWGFVLYAVLYVLVQVVMKG
jgi:uncharacterized membrane protein